MAQLSPLMESVLSNGGTVDLTVTGNSMFPMLKHRVSRVRLAAADSLTKGDIPLYRRDNGKFVLHRIVEHNGDSYSCCGDNQWYLETGIRKDQMIAVVTAFARGTRWVSCSDPFYGFYWRTWVAVRPVRRLIFGGFGRIKRAVVRLLG